MIPVSIHYDDYIDQPKMTEHSRLTSGEWGGGCNSGGGQRWEGLFGTAPMAWKICRVGVGGGMKWEEADVVRGRELLWWEGCGMGSTSKNRPSHHNYQSPKQFLWIACLETIKLKALPFLRTKSQMGQTENRPSEKLRKKGRQD